MVNIDCISEKVNGFGHVVFQCLTEMCDVSADSSGGDRMPTRGIPTPEKSPHLSPSEPLPLMNISNQDR